MFSEQEKTNQLADAAFGREREIHYYQINIDNYTAMLADLPQDDWPAGLEQYKNVPSEQLPFDAPLETVQSVSDYQYRDRIRSLLRTEQLEQSKAVRVLNALKSQLPAGEYAALLDAAKARATV